MNILEKVNILILLVTISYIMALSNLLSNVADIQAHVRWLITFFTTVGLFRLLILLVYWLIHRSDALLALYHRNRFVKGLWTYSYEANGKRHFGIWRISQDVASISITGYVIDEDGRMDSQFRSISQPFEHQGVDEIMFARTDIASGDEHYSNRRFTSIRSAAAHGCLDPPISELSPFSMDTPKMASGMQSSSCAALKRV